MNLQKNTDISNDQIEIILHSCKTILFFNDECLIKKDSIQDLFDVPMGSYHGAEICDLVGLYILHNLTEDKTINNANCGLYRDDGLLIVKNCSPRIIDQLIKSIIKSFQINNLKVKIELCNKR